MDYFYILIYLLSMPIVWKILLTLHIEKHFEAGKVFIIRAAYVITTLIISHLFAISVVSFCQAVSNLF